MELLDIAQDYWIVITAFVGIIISWANLKMQNANQQNQINELREDLKNTKDDIKAMNPILVEIRTKLASIEATLMMLCKEK